MYNNYEEVIWPIVEQLLNPNFVPAFLTQLEREYLQGIEEDQTGEGFIYEMLAWFMQVNDFEHTDDFSAIISKTGLTVDAFLKCTRLRRGLWKVFRLHYPDKLERPEYSLLFLGLDEDKDRSVLDVALAVATVRDCSVEDISESEVSEAMDRNREILDLYKELLACASLAIAIPEDDDDPSLAYLGLRASDPNQQGAMIRYGDDGYDLFQLVYDFPSERVLGNRVAASLSMEEAKAAGQLFFDEDSKVEKILRIPLSSSSYAQAAFPFKDFRVRNPEGKDGKLSGNQEFFKQCIDEFFDGMSRESREFLRDLKL